MASLSQQCAMLAYGFDIAGVSRKTNAKFVSTDSTAFKCAIYTRVPNFGPPADIR
jgi:hypothetical protein